MQSVTNSKMISTQYSVIGMSCASCAANIEKNLALTSGVIKANVNFPNQMATIEYDQTKVSEDDLKKIIKSWGYEIHNQRFDIKTQENNDIERTKNYIKLKTNTFYSILLSTPIVIVSMVFPESVSASNWIQLFLSAIVLFGFGKSFFINAFKQARHLNASMDSLVALSTGIAFIYSSFNTIYPNFLLNKGLTPHVYFEAAVVIISFILLGKTLEES